VIKHIPAGIERRLVENSCNEELFWDAVPDYQAELNRYGYRYTLSYNKPVIPSVQPMRRKNRRVTCHRSVGVSG
jgi:hypothetical protein